MKASLIAPGLSTNAWSEEAPSDRVSRSGFGLEEQIENGLRARGFQIIPAREWDQSEDRDNPSLRKVILDAPYASIYGHAARIEFLVLLPGRRILLEVKRQNTPGSVDEKLPYVYLNAQLNITFGQEFVLVLDGDGWKDGAVDWINKRGAETAQFSVFTPDDFFHWIEGL